MPARLFARRGRDLGHDLVDPADLTDDVLHGAPRTVHQLRAGTDLGHRGVDQLLDLLGSTRRALRQRPHFTGHHCEATALFTGARRFHCGVQRQDVGLERDAIDHRDDLGDTLRRRLDLLHRVHHLADHLAAFAGHARCGTGQRVCLQRMVGILAHGGGQFFHRRGGFCQVGGLLFGAARQVAVAGGDFTGGQADAGRRLLDLADDLGQLLHGAVGIVAHHRKHAVEVALHARTEVTGGDRAQQRRQCRQVVVADLHHCVQGLHHAAEIMLEAQCITAHGEVTGGGGGGQLLDLLVDSGQVALGGRHCGSEHRLLARQHFHVHAEVAHGIALHHFNAASLQPGAG